MFRKISCNTEMSQTATNSVQETLYQRALQCYTEPQSFCLSQTDQGYELCPNHAKLADASVPEPAKKQPKNDKYIFVITENSDGQPQLKIGTGSHFHLSNKASEVFAAGEITFEEGKIVTITDQSGAFHLDMEKLSEAEKEEYKASLQAVMQYVGLPYDRYVPFKKENNASDASEKTESTITSASSWYGFFYNKASDMFTTASKTYNYFSGNK